MHALKTNAAVGVVSHNFFCMASGLFALPGRQLKSDKFLSGVHVSHTPIACFFLYIHLSQVSLFFLFCLTHTLSLSLSSFSPLTRTHSMFKADFSEAEFSAEDTLIHFISFVNKLISVLLQVRDLHGKFWLESCCQN